MVRAMLCRPSRIPTSVTVTRCWGEFIVLSQLEKGLSAIVPCGPRAGKTALTMQSIAVHDGRRSLRRGPAAPFEGKPVRAIGETARRRFRLRYRRHFRRPGARCAADARADARPAA